MNKLKIAGTVAEMRHRKGITQEELAEHMGVSRAAVSKWEKGQSYPDITLLPRLAAYFNISVDELLGYSPQLNSAQIRSLCRNQSSAFTNKLFDEAMSEFKELIKEYYSCIPFIFRMSLLLVNHFSGLAEKVHYEAIRYAGELFKHVVSDCGDAALACEALHMQAFCALLLEQPDDVFSLLGRNIKAQSFSEGSLIAKAFAQAGDKDKAKEIYQCSMYNCLFLLVESLADYTYLQEDDFQMAQTAFNRVMELIRLFNVGKLNPESVVKVYLIGADMYCKQGMPENALDLLEKYLDFCTTEFFPFIIGGDDFFTNVDEWLDFDRDDMSVIEQKIKIGFLHDLHEFPSFAILNNNKKYKQIVKKLNEFAKGRA